MWLNRILALVGAATVVVAVRFVVDQLAWVDTRPVCSGLAMKLRPELAGECFTGPRPLIPDPGLLPWLALLLGLLAAIGTVIWMDRRARSAR